MSKYTITVDTNEGIVTREQCGTEISCSLGTPEAFKIVSDLWLRCGWDNKHIYSFTWMGRPIIQLPEDMFRIQEAIYQLKPDIIIETGIAHGGSLIFYASLFRAIGKGRVIGVDIEIRPHNRTAIESHELFDFITLIEGSSTDSNVVNRIEALIKPHETVMVILDSNHSKAHVLKELQLYSKFVTPGFYIIAADGIMQAVAGAPRTQPDWSWNNPQSAAIYFALENPEFEIKTPEFIFNEGNDIQAVTHWPNAWLYKKTRQPAGAI